jgi:hypothetical protein
MSQHRNPDPENGKPEKEDAEHDGTSLCCDTVCFTEVGMAPAVSSKKRPGWRHGARPHPYPPACPRLGYHLTPPPVVTSCSTADRSPFAS